MAKMPISKFQFYDDHVNRFGGEDECVCNASENKFGECLREDAIYYGYDAGYDFRDIGSLIMSARAILKRLETDKIKLIPVAGWN
jgi:hypothetical protein